MPNRTRFIALLATLLGTLAWALSAAPAQAGGPTSVLLVDRVNGTAAGLYVGQPGYDHLLRSVDFKPDNPSAKQPSSVTEDYNNRIMLTWMVHDVSIWRIDEVFVTASDGIWVSTQLDYTGEGNPIDKPAAWHRPVDDKMLVAALHSSGLQTKPPVGGTRRTVPSPMFPASTQPQSQASANALPATTSTGSGGPSALVAAGAGVAGLVVGAGGMLLYRRARSSRPDDPDRVVLTG